MQHTSFWKSATTILAAGLFSAGVTAAPINLVDNGGFESGLAGWTVDGFLAEDYDYGIDGLAHSGVLAFFGGALQTPGFLSQSIATDPDKTYQLNLWLLSDGFLPNQFQVRVGGVLVLDFTDILIAPYAPIHLNFLATGSTTPLEFGFRNDSGYLHVDDIVVSQAVPEPATAALLGIGGVLLLLRRRSVRRSTTA